MTSRWDSVSGGGVDFVIRFSRTKVLQERPFDDNL
jgi:hypothetical protein